MNEKTTRREMWWKKIRGRLRIGRENDIREAVETDQDIGAANSSIQHTVLYKGEEEANKKVIIYFNLL